MEAIKTRRLFGREETISASMQQPADFFCKEFLSGQHRLEAPFPLLA
jgi:hypothetical protein